MESVDSAGNPVRFPIDAFIRPDDVDVHLRTQKKNAPRDSAARQV
jgi:hypothetical protein